MKNTEIIGVDISKDKADIHLLNRDEHLVVKNNGFDKATAKLKRIGVKVIAIEATGGYEKPFVASCADAGLPIAIVSPKRVRNYAKALGITAKTDKLDAKVIARFASDTELMPRTVPDEKTREMQEIIARRRQLIQMRTAEKNRLAQVIGKHSRKSIKVVLRTLEKELSDIDDDLDLMVRESPETVEKNAILKSVPGVGDQVSRTLIADLPELGSLSRTEIASLIGVAPHNRDSGRFRGRRSISGGRAAVRSSLYMAALTGIRNNEIIKSFYNRLKLNGKIFKVAIVACMRKLLVILNTMVKNKTYFRDQNLVTPES